LLIGVVVAAGCGGGLPDPDSAGARVLRARCGGCHRVYAPGTMTSEMWKVQVERMHELFQRRGIAWLTPDEQRALLDYLARHAGAS
jgi:hypothetical protein